MIYDEAAAIRIMRESNDVLARVLRYEGSADDRGRGHAVIAAAAQWQARAADRQRHTLAPPAAADPRDGLPRRDDAVSAWLKRARDEYAPDEYGRPALDETDRIRYRVLDDLLDEYRLRADTGTPLGEHACDGPHCCADDLRREGTPGE